MKGLLERRELFETMVGPKFETKIFEVAVAMGELSEWTNTFKRSNSGRAGREA